MNVITYKERLTSENVDRILADGWDVIVDGADNFPTRYLVNDAAVFHDIPLVHGSIYRFEGQATVFKPALTGPCYRCLFPQPPPPELAPSCAEGGVLGVLPGIIGSLQANEALKLALGIGETALGPPAPLRRALHRVQRGHPPARPELPRLRRAPDDHRVHRLRRVLRREGRRTHEHRPDSSHPPRGDGRRAPGERERRDGARGARRPDGRATRACARSSSRTTTSPRS